MDLGFHLVRHWWTALLVPWAATIALFAAAVVFVLPDRPGAAFLLFWLLKPIYDRVPLHVLSRALFGAAPSWPETFSALPALLTRDLPWTLIHRIDFARSFNLPVRQLERLRGADARSRARILQRQTRSHAVGLTLLFLLLELVAFLSVLWIGPMILPQGVDQHLLDLVVNQGSEGGWLAWVLAGAYMATVLVLEPFYVAAGFGLYLNRRTGLEAWDVELRFRRLTRRAGSPVPLAVALALAVAAWVPPPDVLAESPPALPPVNPTPRPEVDAGTVVERVLEGAAFERYREVEYWSFKGADEQDEDSDGWDLGVASLLARLTEAALWGALGVGLVLLIVHRRRWLPFLGRRQTPRAPEPPATLLGLDIRPESLPGDVPAEARRLWAAGAPRQALGLLYRGALAALVHKRGIPFSAGDTEGECLAKVRPAADAALYGHFRELTGAWEGVAYAHRPPDPRRVESLLEDWHTHYGEVS
jgi:hypothetical protein